MIVTVEEVKSFLANVDVDPPADDVIESTIKLVTDQLEDACGCRFEPREETVTVEARNGQVILEPMVIDVTEIDGESASIGPYRSGVVPMADGTYTISYRHGHETVPARVKRAVLLLTRHVLNVDPTDWDNRATFKSNDLASWSLITPGVKGAVTPIPEVNQVIADYQFPGGIA